MQPGFRVELRSVSLVAGQVSRQAVTLRPILLASTPPVNGKLHLDIRPVEAQVSVSGMPTPAPVKSDDGERAPGNHTCSSRARETRPPSTTGDALRHAR
jgi:hypothetical protein